MKTSGEDYYKYMLLYVDNILHLVYDPKDNINALNSTYILKEYSGGWPKIYIGANIDKVQIDNGMKCWSINCVDCLQVDIKNAYGILLKDNG